MTAPPDAADLRPPPALLPAIRPRFVSASRLNSLGRGGLRVERRQRAIGSIPAVMNALNDALAAIGAPSVALPATPEKLWRAIRAAGT
jgi:aerobic carbon-monoxide dehydrogenase large subunit